MRVAQILAEHADSDSDYVVRRRDWKGGDRNPTRQRLEQDQAVSIEISITRPAMISDLGS
jgi:hypothetical protein